MKNYKRFNASFIVNIIMLCSLVAVIGIIGVITIILAALSMHTVGKIVTLSFLGGCIWIAIAVYLIGKE